MLRKSGSTCYSESRSFETEMNPIKHIGNILIVSLGTTTAMLILKSRIRSGHGQILDAIATASRCTQL